MKKKILLALVAILTAVGLTAATASADTYDFVQPVAGFSGRPCDLNITRHKNAPNNVQALINRYTSTAPCNSYPYGYTTWGSQGYDTTWIVELNWVICRNQPYSCSPVHSEVAALPQSGTDYSTIGTQTIGTTVGSYISYNIQVWRVTAWYEYGFSAMPLASSPYEVLIGTYWANSYLEA